LVVVSCYPKGDLRRLLAVLGAIDQLAHPTLSSISAALGFGPTGGHTVRRLMEQASEQAGVKISRVGFTYRIDDWGPALARGGALMAWHARQNIGALVTTDASEVENGDIPVWRTRNQ
jgi:hypothetical protein